MWKVYWVKVRYLQLNSRYSGKIFYMNKRIKGFMKKAVTLVMAAIQIITFTGCASKQDDNESTYRIYCLDKDENKLLSYEYDTLQTDLNELAKELVKAMSEIPDDVKKKEVIKDFTVTDINISDRQITLTVSETYRIMPPEKEVLIRAAIVKTLGQIDGIDYVAMKLPGEDLLDALGQPIGPMTVAQYVDNAEDEFNTYDNIELVLYFADSDGEGLIKTIRKVEYNTNIAPEKLVVEQLIAGVAADDLKETVNPQTEIINVTVKDGICYVNLTSAFLTLPEGIRPEVALYSVTDSLVELSGISKVQLSVEGNSDIMLGENLSLTSQYERNLDIVR